MRFKDRRILQKNPFLLLLHPVKVGEMRKKRESRRPAAWVSAIPLAVLVGMLALVIRCFGSDGMSWLAV